MLKVYIVDGLYLQYEEGNQPEGAVLFEPKKAQTEHLEKQQEEQPKQKAKKARNKSVQAQTK